MFLYFASSFLPLIVILTLPFIVAFRKHQTWHKRPTFIMLGLIAGIVIFYSTLIFISTILRPILFSLGLNIHSGSQLTSAYIYISTAAKFILGIGATYWLLVKIAPTFQKLPT
jgi:hypothetical protein